MKKFTAVLIVFLFVVSVLAGCGNSKEKKAQELYESGEYEAAARVYEELGDYEKQAQALYDAGGYEEAAEIYAKLGKKKMQAESLYAAGRYGDAYEIFNEINDLAGVSKSLTGMRAALNKIKPAN